MFDLFTITGFLLIVALAFIGRSFLGFGFSLIFVPIASLFYDFQTVVKAAVIFELVNNFLFSIRYRKDLRLASSIAIKVFSILGVIIGLPIKNLASESIILILSMSALASVIILFLRKPPSFKQNVVSFSLTGLASGLLNSWASFSGPPVALFYFSSLRGNKKIRGALAGYFLLLYASTVGIFLFNGEYKDFPFTIEIVLGSILIIALYMILSLFSKVQHALENRYNIKRIAFLFLLAICIITIVKELISNI